MPKTTTVTLRVPKTVKARLARLATATQRSSSCLAAHALEVYLSDQEWQVARFARARRMRRPGMSSHTPKCRDGCDLEVISESGRHPNANRLVENGRR
jgi:predicted transcriptional regulator